MEVLARRGLTLVELMIVVSLLAILAAIVLPTFSNANQEAVAKSTATNFKTLADAVWRYKHMTGQWPADYNAGEKPTELEDFLTTVGFVDSPLGGEWDYDNWYGYGRSTADGDSIGIAITIWNVGGDTAIHTAVDEILDDGDLSTGAFQAVNNLGKPRLMYLLRGEE